MLKNLIRAALYGIANVLCIVAERVAPLDIPQPFPDEPPHAEVQALSDRQRMTVHRWKCWDCDQSGPEVHMRLDANKGLNDHLFMCHPAWAKRKLYALKAEDGSDNSPA